MNSIKFKGLPDSDDLSKFNAEEMVSFSELGINKHIKKSATALIKMDTKVLSRIYPQALRIASDNYDPTPSWNTGAQVVALNYQDYGLETLLNHGKYEDNGRAGYVLKPAFLRPTVITRDDGNTVVSQPTFNPQTGPFMPRLLRIRVLSARALPKPDDAEKGMCCCAALQIDCFFF